MTDRSHILPEHDVRPYSVAQLADRWGCSDSMIRKLINQGELACFRIGTLFRIPAAEVQRYEATTAEPIQAPVENLAPAVAAQPRRVIPRAKRKHKPITINRSSAVKAADGTTTSQAIEYLQGIIDDAKKDKKRR